MSFEPVGFPIAVATVIFLAPLFLWGLRSLNGWIYERSLAFRGMLPPGSLGWPVIGEMREFLSCFKNERPDSFVAQRMQRFGKVGAYKTHLMGSASVMIISAEWSKFVLSRDDLFGVGWPSRNKIMGASALVSLTGEKHKRLRKYLADAIACPEGMKRVIPRIEDHIKTNLNSWAEAGETILRQTTKKMTFNVIIEYFASLQPSIETALFEEQYENVLKGVRALPVYLPGTAHYNAVNSRLWLIGKYQAMLDERKTSKTVHGDFLDSLMNAKGEAGVKLTDEEITDNMMTLVIAGHESTAYTLLWVVVLLAKHPEYLEKVREEQMRIKTNKAGRAFTWEDTREMTYSSQVIDETLRLVNIAPFLFRTALEDVETDGIVIPKGWKVLPWLRAIHMDPEHFVDPQRFNPDRWTGQVVKGGAFQPFGSGGRSCVGNLFAKLQVCMFLHYATVDYTWELVNPNAKIIHLPHPKPVDGVPVIFRRREKT